MRMKYEDVVHDEAQRRMRRVSGEIDDVRPLVCFLYLLARDHLAVGVVEEILSQTAAGTADEYGVQFTNGWLALWAKDAAGRLR